ncbi:MAG: TlpA family protein disulfide reductase [Candidatus Omnitrophica bacterium]|nr:TlpA family protein disulfide reductase [Candidatus Omnitrophota bacterium]
MKFIVSMLTAGFLLFSAGSVQAGFYDNPMIGQKATDFKLMQLKGGEVTLENLRKGGKAIVMFWATWCPHCREQLKDIAAQKAVLEKAGVTLVLVDIGEDKVKVEKYLSSKGYDLNVLLDQDSTVAETYQVAGVPTIVLIASDGKIRDVGYALPDNFEEILK